MAPSRLRWKLHRAWKVLTKVVLYPARSVWFVFFALPGRGIRVLFRLLGRPGAVLGRLLLLPVELLFLVFDFFAVNLSKTRFPSRSCRDRLLGPQEQLCRPSRKYTNRLLFRCICRDVRFEPHASDPLCDAGEERTVYLLRGAFASLLILLAAGGVIWLTVAQWPRLAPGRDQAAQQQALLQARTERAAELFQAGDYSQAVRLFRRILNHRPRDPQTHLRLGQCYEQMGEDRKAARHFKWAAETDAPPPLALKWMAYRNFASGMVGEAARYARRTGDAGKSTWWSDAILADRSISREKIKEAQQLLQPALSTAPDEHLTTLVRARLLAAQGKVQKALDELAGIPPDSRLGFMAGLRKAEMLAAAGKPQKVLEVLNNLSRRYPEKAESALLRAQLLFRMGRTQEAIGAAEEVLVSHAGNPAVRLAVARLLDDYGRAGRALQIALKCAGRDPQGVQAHVLAADIYRKRGLYEPARVHAETALAVEPDDGAALLCLGRVALAQGDTGEAIDTFRRLTREAAEDATAWHWLASSYTTAERLEDAEDAWRRACDLAPRSGRLHQELGTCLLRRGKREEAREHLERAVALAPGLYEAHTRLGVLAEQEGNTEQAAEHYERAISSAPSKALAASNNLADLLVREERNLPMALALSHFAYVMASGQPYWPDTAETFAHALMKMGHLQTGRIVARNAAERQPASPGLHYRLATILDKMDRNREALEHCRKALELDDSFEKADEARRLARRLRGAIGETPDESQP